MEHEEPERVPDLPQEAATFRKVVNSLKRVIIRELEEDGETSEIQMLDRYSTCEKKLKHLGQVLRNILQGTPLASGTAAGVVAPIFAAAGLNLAGLPDELKELCEYYVDVDIYTYPWDLNPHHIDAIQSLSLE